MHRTSPAWPALLAGVWCMLPRRSLSPDGRTHRKELAFWPSSPTAEFHSSGIRFSQYDGAPSAVDAEVP